MKKVLFLVFLFSVQSCSVFQSSDSSDMDIYLLIGQSNMAGRAPIPPEHQGTLNGAFVLNTSSLMEAAKHPLNIHSSIRKSASMQKAGPGINFAKQMLIANPNVPIGLVVNAKGGSKMSEWCRTCDFYQQAVKRAKIARAYGNIKGILWLQGESDIDQPEGYLEKLQQLVSHLREDLGARELPFIAAQVYKMPEINKQIAQLPSVSPRTRVVYSEGLTAMDDLHYDFVSIEKIGAAFAKAMQSFE